VWVLVWPMCAWRAMVWYEKEFWARRSTVDCHALQSLVYQESVGTTRVLR
jgi:hypothetical protein